MPDFAVSTAFNAAGNILNKISKMDKGIKIFGDDATKAFRQASRGASGFGNIVKGILAADIIKTGFRSLQNGLRATATDFISYDQAITSASAKFKGLNTETLEGQKTLQSLKDIAREVGGSVDFSASEAASGLDFLAMAGFTAEQAIASLPSVVDLATVAGTDLARATDIASDSLGAFGLMSKDTQQLQKNFTRINDVFAKTITTSNTNMEALFESITKGGPAFTAAGQSLETFSALAGIMANAGIKGSESGTSLRNVMLRLASPAKDASKIMRNLGIQTKDGEGNFRDIIDILADFEKGLVGMGTVQRTAALSTVFGARSVTGINILLQQGTSSLKRYRNSLLEAGGASAKMANVMRGSIGSQLASLKSAALEVGFQFIDTFKDKIGPAIQTVTEAIRGTNIPTLIENFKSFIETASKFRGVLFGMAAGWTAFKIAMAGAAIVQAVQSFIFFTNALRGAAVAQGLLNAVMLANPIGAIAVAIGLLIGGLFLLVDNFDVVSKAFMSVMNVIVFGTLGIIKALLNPFDTITRAISSITNFVTGGTGEAAAASIAPNQSTLAAQEVQFNGQLNIAGAPEGSTFESQTSGAPTIRMVMAGIN